MKDFTRAFLLFFIFPLSLSAQDYDLKIKAADSLVTEFVAENRIPGMSISVYKDDAIVWSQGFGFSNVKEQTPVIPALTKFRIGSVSKTLTAAGMGLLIEQGKLDPEKKVQAYVPSFPEKRYPITVEQVAGHLAGIRHYRGSEFMSKKLYRTIDEGLTIFAADSLLFKPGTRYSYSSYGWNLISAVIEGASGRQFLPFMESEVFDRLGMNNTMPEWTNREIPHLTTFYVPDAQGYEVAPFVDNSYKWAGGGFVGTTEDLIRFGVAFFDDEFLSYETQERLMTPLSTSDGETTNYGLGWQTRTDFAGRKWLGHSGGSVGGSTMFLINKEERMVIAFAINKSSVNFDELHFKIARIFLN